MAERKVRALLGTGALITLVSPEITEGLAVLAEEGSVSYIPRGFETGDLEGAWLAIAATDDERVQAQVFDEAERHRIFCNVVDRPEMCSYIVPSTIRRGALCIAISTSGESPAVAKAIRKRLEGAYGPSWARFLDIAGRLRRYIMENVPDDKIHEKCNAIADLSVVEWIEEDRYDKIMDWAVDICGQEAKDILKDYL